MSKLDELKITKDRKDLSKLLGFKPSKLAYILYKIPLIDKYKTFEINKKNGGKRTIKAPINQLKLLQVRLSELLYQCLDEIEKKNKKVPLAFGFRRKLTIANNAARHKNRRWVLNLDLENFFSSFNFGRVRGFFLKDKSFRLEPEVATTIAQIACDGIALPQGSPSSPVISELIARILDLRLVQFAKKYKLTYTRYADDITFSTNQKEFPAGIARSNVFNPTDYILSNELTKEINNCGFKINLSKVRMQFKSSRQSVTGLIVNKKVNIPNDYYKRARAMCNSLFKSGTYFYSMKTPIDKINLTINLNPLHGILNYIYAIKQTEERRNQKAQRYDRSAIRKLYNQFLFYKYFIALQKPLIVTEGKTDPIYLSSAIKYSPNFHPILDKIAYLNYSKLSQEILGLAGGGADNLKSIIQDYHKNLYLQKESITLIQSNAIKYPVIILIDNDDVVKGISDSCKNFFKVTFDFESTAPFYHIAKNLYIVKTPEGNPPKKSCIENLFSAITLETKLNGKTFCKENKFDNKKYYGKEKFARSVIKTNADKIDFTNFSSLLQRIVDVIDDYKNKMVNISIIP